MMFLTPEHVKEEVRKRLRRTPRDDAWDHVEEEGLVADVLKAVDNEEREEPLRYLCSQIKKLENRFAPKEQRLKQVRRALPLDTRARAKAAIEAVEAARLPEVASFRREVLRNQPVKPRNVQSWVDRKSREPGAGAYLGLRLVDNTNRDRGLKEPAWFQAALPPGFDDYRFITVFPDRELPRESIQYPIRVGSDLERLKSVVVGLRGRYGWEEWDAVPFVLAGTPPPGHLATARIHPQEDEVGEARIGFIEIKADPTASPKEVATLFAEVRGRELTRSKNLSHKHAELGIFAAERNDGRQWGEVLEEWNRVNPDRRYSEIRNFIRDCRTAYQRIMRRKLQWQRPRGGASRQGE